MAAAVTDHDSHDSDGHAHVVPMRVLVTTWLALIFLSVVTVAAAKVDLGPANIWVALMIATVKASIVALYFMHLRYGHPFHALALGAAVLFVAVFIGITILDTDEYQSDFDVPRQVTNSP
jgi:cytochrome c oxidase subunit 4